jgi:hypothetical protein
MCEALGSIPSTKEGKKKKKSRVLVACNPSYSGGRDEEDQV